MVKRTGSTTGDGNGGGSGERGRRASPKRAKPGPSNVPLIVLGDTGFGHLGRYGSPIRTPHLDRLAAGGLQYTNMHMTPLCSPSCARILTGRNHHQSAMARIIYMIRDTEAGLRAAMTHQQAGFAWTRRRSVGRSIR